METMNNLQIFNSPQFGEIRTAGTPENPMFCAADVCRALGYNNGPKAVKDHCDTPDVTKRYIGVVTGKKADGTDAVQRVLTTFINESGLYALIFGSKLATAKAFKQWVTGDVLPTIRKHGAYATEATIEDIIANPENGIRLLTALRDERIQREEAERKAEQLEAQAIENAPKVVYADAVAGSKDACLIGELAKILAQNGIEMGEKRLFQWMRDNKYLCSYGERFNQPYQQYVEQGLFILKQNAFTMDGEMHTRVTTKVTGKGQLYFVNKFLKSKPTMA
jgi:anti-repressor protein